MYLNKVICRLIGNIADCSIVQFKVEQSIMRTAKPRLRYLCKKVHTESPTLHYLENSVVTRPVLFHYLFGLVRTCPIADFEDS
jgi:hypothetical protein